MGALKIIGGILFCFLAIIYHCEAQEEVPWNNIKRLTWNDFKGEVPLGAVAAATTASGISYKFSTHNKGNKMIVDYDVSSFFYPTKSWYRPAICNDVTLIHEQLHFDISELFARKMSREMAQTLFTKNVKAEVKAIYKRTLRKLNDFQNKYDNETDYSRNVSEQKRWVLKINEELAIN